jgi:tetratricopeptide (TPR) repeat protein
MKLSHYARPLGVRIALILLLGVSLLLTTIPLFNYLGYEFSAVIAIVISIIAGFVGVGRFRAFARQTGSSDPSFRRFYGDEAKAYALFLLLPFIVISANIVLVRNCSYLEGILFYLLIPVVTAVFSVALAGMCATLFYRARSMYFVVWLAILGHISFLGYFTPQIYAYNFILGYFPGFSYDEVLSPTTTLVGFRLVTIFVAGVLVTMTTVLVDRVRPRDSLVTKFVGVVSVFTKRPWNGRVFFLIFSVIVLVVVWIVRIELGFESSLGAIAQRLDRTYSTEHFLIHYAGESFSDEEIRSVADEHEFQLGQVAEKLQVRFGGKIRSFVYPDDETKRRFIGAGATNIAKPWRREIHMNKDSWRNVVKHELVHVVAGDFGLPVIRASYNIGLVEGLAMAVEWDFGNRTLHEYAAAVRHFGLVKEPRKLLSVTGFAMQASTVSYVLTGSFVRFLIDRYGMMRFKDVYRGRDIQYVYGKDEAGLVWEWEQFLGRYSIPENWKDHVSFFFARKSIFARECARYIAKLNQNASRAFRAGNSEAAVEGYRKSLRESWNTEALVGLARVEFSQGEYDTVIHLLSTENEERPATVAHAMVLYGDALWARDSLDASKEAYQTVFSLDLSDAHNEAASLRLAVLSDSLLSTTLKPVFVGAVTDSLRLALVEKAMNRSRNPVTRLLRAQLVYRMRNYGEALSTLESAPAMSDPSLSALAERLRALSSFALRRFDRARVHFWNAMNFSPNEATRLRLNEWIDRCEFLEDRRVDDR